MILILKKNYTLEFNKARQNHGQLSLLF